MVAAADSLVGLDRRAVAVQPDSLPAGPAVLAAVVVAEAVVAVTAVVAAPVTAAEEFSRRAGHWAAAACLEGPPPARPDPVARLVRYSPRSTP